MFLVPHVLKGHFVHICQPITHGHSLSAVTATATTAATAINVSAVTATNSVVVCSERLYLTSEGTDGRREGSC